MILEQEIDKSTFQLGFFRKEEDLDSKDEHLSDHETQHRKIHYKHPKEEKELKSQVILSVNLKLQGFDLKIDIREDDNVKEIIDKTTAAGLNMHKDMVEALEIYVLRKLESMGKLEQIKPPLLEQSKPSPSIPYESQPSYRNGGGQYI